MIQTGLARLIAEGSSLLEGKRLGLICNPTAVDGQLRHAIDLMAATKELSLVSLFGPEHGVRGDAQDMITVDPGRDARTGLPVHSLYGSSYDTLSPTPAMLDEIDILVYDVQDIGSRYYTFVWTMVLAMRAFTPSRPTVALLGAGFWLQYRRRKPARADGAACDCPAPRASRTGRVLLWVATVAVAGLLAFPYAVPLLFG